MTSPEPEAPEVDPEPVEGTEELGPGQPSELPADPGGAPRRPLRRTVLVIVVAVAVVVAGLGGAYLSGIGPFSHGASGAAATAQTFEQATATANASATAYQAGNWVPVLAAGADIPEALAVSTAFPSDLLGTGCPGTAVGNGDVVTFAPYSGSLSAGAAPDWLFLMVNGQTSILVITVVGGQGTVWEAFSGTGCSTFSASGGVPAATVDTPAVVDAFLTGGGQSFINSHAGGSLSFDVLGAYGYAGWWVGYSTCPEGSTAGSGYNYSASFYARNGTVDGVPQSGAASRCGGLNLVGDAPLAAADIAPIASVLTLSQLAGAWTALGAAYTLTVSSASSTLIWNDLTFSFAGPTGVAIAGTELDSVVIAGSSGCEIATGLIGLPFYSAPTTNACAGTTDNGGAPVRSGDIVTVSNATALSPGNDTLSVSGAPAYRGAINLTIPTITTVRQALVGALSISAVASVPSPGVSTYTVTVTSAAPTLVWAEVATELETVSGTSVSAADAVDIFGPSGCEVALGQPNSSAYYAPIFNACTGTVGTAAPVVAGQTVAISTVGELDGAGYQWVAVGEHLFQGSVAVPFNGVVTPINGMLTLSRVTETNGSSVYTYSVNVTSLSGALALGDIAVTVNASGIPNVAGPYQVDLYAPAGCDLGTAAPNSSAYSVPATNACSSQPVGDNASLAVGDRLVLSSHQPLYGATGYANRETLLVSGAGSYGGSVYVPLPVWGGPLNFALPLGVGLSLPTAGTAGADYTYTLTVHQIDAYMVAADLGLTGVNATFATVLGPYSVNITASSGCVLATGPANSSAYVAPTTNACANSTLGAGAIIGVGDHLVLFSSLDLSGLGDYVAVLGLSAYYGSDYYGIA